MELNKQFWMEMKQYVKSVNPNIFLLAEVWLPANQAAAFATGFDSMFNFDLATGILKTVKDGYQTNFVTTYLNGKQNFISRNDNFIDATFLTNHDQNRVMNELGEDKQKAALAANILFTLPGLPFIYYGEELGMLGAKPDEQIREPYRWTSTATTPNAMWEQWKLNGNTVPYALQKDDAASMFSVYRNLVHLREASQILRFGEITALETTANNQNLLGYVRTYEGKQLTVIHNLTQTSVTVALSSGKTILYAHGGAKLQGSNATLPAYSSIVIGE
jgi:glycosidase